ncbi:hypothetical protein [Abiotrophia defectiva]
MADKISVIESEYVDLVRNIALSHKSIIASLDSMNQLVNDIVTTSIQSKNIQQNIQLIMTDYGQVFRGKLEESFAKTEELIVEFASRIEAADW